MSNTAEESANAIYGKGRTIEILEATGPYSNIKISFEDTTVEEAVIELDKLRRCLKETFPDTVVTQESKSSTEPSNNEPKKEYSEGRKCTPNQAKAVWAIAKKQNIDLNGRDTNNFTMDEVTEFFNKYGEKK